MQQTWVQLLGWEDPLEKEMVTHSSNLAGEIPRTEEPSGPQSMGSQRAGHNLATKQEQILSTQKLVQWEKGMKEQKPKNTCDIKLESQKEEEWKRRNILEDNSWTGSKID